MNHQHLAFILLYQRDGSYNWRIRTYVEEEKIRNGEVSLKACTEAAYAASAAIGKRMILLCW